MTWEAVLVFVLFVTSSVMAFVACAIEEQREYATFGALVCGGCGLLMAWAVFL